jgi:hypothetical protein
MRTKKLAVISAVFLTLSAASAHAATTMLLIGVGNGGGVASDVYPVHGLRLFYPQRQTQNSGVIEALHHR